ncbi:MAG: hypothetical protein FWD25_00065 [Clostridia bacterium]|nr:hypothetical protein [Clostridia bacterium]
MSYFSYLSCNRELPTGFFGKPPKAIYPSYDAYRSSPDYVVPQDLLTGKPRKIDENDITACLKGNVIVYATNEDSGGVRITPYSPIVTICGTQKIDDDVSCYFTFPFRYNTTGHRSSLEKYLCKYLQPGDQAQHLTCWAGGGKSKSDTWEEKTIDLQWVIDNNGWAEYTRIKNNSTVLFLAPKAPLPEIDIYPVKNPDFSCQIIQEGGFEAFTASSASAQGIGF